MTNCTRPSAGGGPGKPDAEGSPGARFALDPDQAAVLADDPVDEVEADDVCRVPAGDRLARPDPEGALEDGDRRDRAEEESPDQGGRARLVRREVEVEPGGEGDARLDPQEDILLPGFRSSGKTG